MAQLSWMDVLTETKHTSPPPSSAPAPSQSPPPASPPASPSRNVARSSGMLTCLRPPEIEDEDDDFGPPPMRKVNSPPRKLSRRTGDEDAGSGSDRSSESPRRNRNSTKPSFFVNTDQPTQGDPPIWVAANDGDIATFKACLNPESARVMNKHKDTLLHLAVIRGRNDMVRLLLPPSGLPLVPIDALNLYGESPLHRACSTGNTAVVQILIERGANVNTPNVYGETPFYAAAYAGHTAIIELLLAMRGVRYRESGDENMRPINLARNRRHEGVVRAILQHDRWRIQRLFWIAHAKNPHTPWASLNAAIIRRIVRYIQPPLSTQL